MSYLEERTRSLFGRAVHHYGLIRAGDRVAVGLSGGKDSLSLLTLLAERRRRVPSRFELSAVWVDLGRPGVDGQALAAFCRELGVELHRVAAEWRPEEVGSCYACARLRRRRLFEAAAERGCNRLALGHNLDDLLETFFLNLVFNGQASTMLPREDFFNGRFQVVRPLLLVPADMLGRFARKRGLPAQTSSCPVGQVSARARLRELLKPIYGQHRRARENIWRGLTRLDPDALPRPAGPGPANDWEVTWSAES